MKKFFSTQCSDGAFNLGTFVLRVTFGLLLLIDHGLGKITHFSEYEFTFYNFLNIGHRWSLVLCIFAEVVCAGLLALGLFTRFAALVLVINFSVASFLALKGQPLEHREVALVFLAAFVTLLLTGPGKYSVDGAMGK
jgi:putative oxidoreductase